MELTSEATDMFGGAPKRPFHETDDGSHEPSNYLCRDSANHPRASRLSEMDLGDIPVPWRDVADIDNHSGVGVGVLRYVGVGYRGFATEMGRLVREAAFERPLPLVGCDGDNGNVMH